MTPVSLDDRNTIPFAKNSKVELTMVNIGVKTSTEISEHSDWSDATTSYIEGRANCPHCGKKLRIACDKDLDSLHIQKDQD